MRPGFPAGAHSQHKVIVSGECKESSCAGIMLFSPLLQLTFLLRLWTKPSWKSEGKKTDERHHNMRPGEHKCKDLKVQTQDGTFLML